MNNELVSKHTTHSPATIEDKAQQLDVAAEKFGSALGAAKTPFASALALSTGIKTLRELLDDEIMGEIMNLADTPLGFLTDRGPSSRGRDGRPAEPYKMSEVRDAIIEASLRGFRVAGNEFNIIAGRFYAAKVGLHRKVVTYPGVTDFKETFGVPKLAGDKGAIVTASATWTKDGVKCELSRDFSIRVNAIMGPDAVVGKCQRKLYAAVLNRLSGIVTPEGEIDDAPAVRLEDSSRPARPVFNGLSSNSLPSRTQEVSPSGDSDTRETAKPTENLWQYVVASFVKLGVSADDLLDKMELENEEEVTREDCDKLHSLYLDIEGKRTTVSKQFPRAATVQTPAKISQPQEDFLSGVVASGKK